MSQIGGRARIRFWAKCLHPYLWKQNAHLSDLTEANLFEKVKPQVEATTVGIDMFIEGQAADKRVTIASLMSPTASCRLTSLGK